MRIVLVNWAKIWDGASHGGGVNGYCQALAPALRDRGHDLVYLSSGTTYLPEPTHCFARRHPDWLGVRVFEVVNSPVIAPSLVQFKEPMGEASSPELERVVSDLFAAIRPDVVHWHNVEGFSAGCVSAAKAAGAKVFFSLHNYHTVCPQVYFMQKHRELCTSFDNGHACASCVDMMDPAQEKRKIVEKAIAADPARQIERTRVKAWNELKDSLYWITRAVRSTGSVVLPSVFPLPDAKPVPGAGTGAKAPAFADSVPDPFPVRSTEDATRSLAALPTDPRGKTAYYLSQNQPGWTPHSNDPQRRVVLNVIEPEPASSRPPNDYARRRAAMVEMLNSCDGVLPVSSFVNRKFRSLGVRAERIRTLPIGTRINRIVRRAPELTFNPRPFAEDPHRPIRLVFLGYNHYYKGLSMLYESLEMVAPEHLRRFHLYVYALDGHTIEWLFRRLEPRLAGLTFQHGYEFHDLPWLLGGKDLGVVCSVWWDNAPQTVFEFMACGVPVLGAEVGGIPDFVHEGVNGLLFRGNDRAHLAVRLSEVAKKPTILDTIRRAVRPPKDIEDNAAELETVYSQGITSIPDLPPDP